MNSAELFRLRWLGVAMVAGLLPGALAVAQTAGQDTQSTTTLRIGTQLRVLDVTVLDRNGNPITEGLSKGDFRIFDGKRERQVLSFEATDVRAGTPTPPRTIIVIDHLNSTWDQQTWQQKKVRDYFKNQAEVLPLETELLLLTHDGVQMCQGFTRDREELLSAVGQIDPRVPYRLTGSWTSENFQLEMSALEEVSLQVRGMAGRKNVLYLGTGGPGISMVGQSATVQDKINQFVRRSSDNLLDSRVTLFVIKPDIEVGDTRNPNGGGPETTGLDGSGAAGVDQQISSTITVGDPFTGSVNLGLIARTTGGKLYTGRNDIDSEFEEAQALGSKYYTLSYKPDIPEKDGKFIPIKITVDKPGLHVLTKDGYFALKDGALFAPALQGRYDIRRAGQSGLPFRDIDVAAHGVKRDARSRTVEFAVTLRPSQLTWEKAADGSYVGSINIAAVCVNSIKDMLASTAKVMAVKSTTLAGSQIKDSKLPVTIAVRVPRSTNHVRIVVRDVGSNRLGAVDIDKKTAEATPEAALSSSAGGQ